MVSYGHCVDIACGNYQIISPVAVDACLSNGLKRRALGLFKTNSTTALLQKVAKNCDAAAQVWKKVIEIENADPNK